MRGAFQTVNLPDVDTVSGEIFSSAVTDVTSFDYLNFDLGGESEGL